MTVVFDAGAFVAAERGDDELYVVIKRERRLGRAPVTHGGVVAQVWRGGSGRQARLARFLAATDVAALDDSLGRRAGLLLRATGGSDAIDAALVALCRDDDEVFTSDVDDIGTLARAADLHVDVIPV